MVEYKSDFDELFRALADPTRRAMLSQLAGGATSVSALAEPHEMSLAGASKHVKVLEDVGLVRREKVGRSQVCSLIPEPLHEAEHWLSQRVAFWTHSLDKLENALKADLEDTTDD